MSGINSLFHYHCLKKYNIVLADGFTYPVLGKCVIHLTQSMSFFELLYVPNFSFSLLFVSQLIKSLQSSVTFSPNSCTF